MMSFMKAHKKANSLDESPSRIAGSPPRTGKHGDYSDSHMEDAATFDPSTPSQISHNSNGTKHSPGFESLHRLANKKMFSTKLFKKNSSSTVLPQLSAPIGNHFDILSTPDTPNRNSGPAIEAAQSRKDEGTIPAIKGTITHNWGDNTDKQQPVIILNNPSEVDSLSSQDLEPAVRITSLRRDSAISALTSGSYENTLPRAQSADDQFHRRSELARDRHVYNELCKVKSKNRQARIHSHDDIISFEKASTVSLELLESTLSPLAPTECLTQPSNTIDKSESPSVNRKQLSLNGKLVNDSCTLDGSKKDYLRLSVDFADTPRREADEVNDTDDDSETEEEDGSMLLTPDIDEEDDDASKFSFEMSGLNGRTSSVKYYSKPEPKEAIYIDDVYDDEDFDEDMNFYEDDDDDFQFTGRTCISAHNSLGGSNNIDPNAGKPLKRYNDLFELSDDADDSDYENDENMMFTTDTNEEYEAVNSGEELPASQSSDHEEPKDLPAEDYLNATLKSKLGVVLPIKQAPAKAVKSFSDIFDLDDDEEDNEDDLLEDQYGYDDDKSKRDEDIQSIGKDDKDRPRRVFEDLSKDVSDCTGEENLLPKGEMTARPKTPIHIFVTPPVDASTSSATIADPSISPDMGAPPLPPPARSQALKIHDLSSNLDSEIPGLMSNLYFIDEAEEDNYNERNKIADDDYLDEINTVPEDFTFSDSEQDLNSLKSPLRRSSKGSFRTTHSYSGQPVGAAKESTPARNKLEIKNKTVTFFNYSGERSPTERLGQTSDGFLVSSSDAKDDYVISPIKKEGEVFTPVTPTNSFSKPIPDYLNDISLSPIQENSSSVDNSPSLPLQ